jgi:uncharacterized protein (DUF4415 family)
MPQKKSVSSASWSDPDDAPELTDAFFADAEVFKGDAFVRRGRGRPKAVTTKEQINVRLDPDVLAVLRASGPGWQSRINAILRDALKLDGGQARLTA